MARAAWLSCDLSEGDFECLIGSAVSRRFSVADEASGGASSRERAERWTWRMLVRAAIREKRLWIKRKQTVSVENTFFEQFLAYF